MFSKVVLAALASMGTPQELTPALENLTGRSYPAYPGGKPSGAAALKRASKKRRNVAKRKSSRK